MPCAPPGGAVRPRAGRGADDTLDRARVSVLVGMGNYLRGGALAEQGQVEEGIPQIRQGMAAYRATGAEWLLTYFLALLAEAYGKAGQAEEGLDRTGRGVDVGGQNGERFYEAELYRLKGMLTLQSRQVSNKSRTSPKQVKTI